MDRNFDSLGAFARHLDNVIRRLEEGKVRALRDIGIAAATRARAKLGDYQQAVYIPVGEGDSYLGNFPAWEPLSRWTLQEKMRLGYSPPDNPLIRTKEMQDSIGYRMEPMIAVTVGTTDKKAVYHEGGTSRMPPRPFIGPAMVETLPYAIRRLSLVVREAFRKAA